MIRTKFHFSPASDLHEIVSPERSIVITDKNILSRYESVLSPYQKIVLDPGEDEKSFETLTHVIEELIRHEADKTTTLIGVGGGVVTDITGFAASIYMRGL